MHADERRRIRLTDAADAEVRAANQQDCRPAVHQ
jgi:hypothetical protein